jgi:hypothetical protein
VTRPKPHLPLKPGPFAWVVWTIMASKDNKGVSISLLVIFSFFVWSLGFWPSYFYIRPFVALAVVVSVGVWLRRVIYAYVDWRIIGPDPVVGYIKKRRACSAMQFGVGLGLLVGGFWAFAYLSMGFSWFTHAFSGLPDHILNPCEYKSEMPSSEIGKSIRAFYKLRDPCSDYDD